MTIDGERCISITRRRVPKLPIGRQLKCAYSLTFVLVVTIGGIARRHYSGAEFDEAPLN